jgi:type III secretion protein D
MTETVVTIVDSLVRNPSFRIKVMTGRHSGAYIDFVESSISISAKDDAKVCISDWTSPALMVRREIDSNGENWRYQTAGSDSDHNAVNWPSLEPLRFGETVLVLGSADVTWPSDAELLSKLRSPQRSGLERKILNRKNILIATLVMASVAVMVIMVTVLRANAERGMESEAERKIKAAEISLKPWLLTGISTQRVGEALVVSGLLSNGDGVHQLRSHLDKLKGTKFLHRYTSVDYVRRALTEATGGTVEVVYVRDEGFRVIGVVLDPESVKVTVHQVLNDMGLQNMKVSYQIARSRSHPMRMAPVRMQSIDFQYEQFPDGTRQVTLQN